MTLPGHSKNTLYEADDYLTETLQAWGYRVDREGVLVQAFRRDTSKPKHAQYSRPMPEDPWYRAYNLYAERTGRARPDDIILLLAHKDSQSWIDSPGANDNAIGTAGVLELAHVFANYTPECIRPLPSLQRGAHALDQRDRCAECQEACGTGFWPFSTSTGSASSRKPTAPPANKRASQPTRSPKELDWRS